MGSNGVGTSGSRSYPGNKKGKLLKSGQLASRTKADFPFRCGFPTKEL